MGQSAEGWDSGYGLPARVPNGEDVAGDEGVADDEKVAEV